MKAPTPLRCLPIAALLLAVPPFAGADEGEDAVGHVATLAGKAVATRPGEAPRELECRDPIYPGDKIETAEGARVGLLVGDLLAHVGQGSELQVESGDSLALQKGAVRVIDPRESGGHARLAVLDAEAEVLGNDAEGYVFREKTGGYAMLCEWDAPLSVARGPEQKQAQPGECVIARSREPIYVAKAHDERLGSPDEDLCSLGPVIGALDLHLSPLDVALGPPGSPWSGVPAQFASPPRSPCDVPGAPCGQALEPPPGTGEVPGGGGTPPF